MSKDTERDVLIYKRLEEELIKPAAGMGRKCWVLETQNIYSSAH